MDELEELKRAGTAIASIRRSIAAISKQLDVLQASTASSEQLVARWCNILSINSIT